MQPMLQLAENPGGVDKRVWRACAGSSVKIPPIGARVYYFPEGHIEQSFLPYHPSHSPRTLPSMPPMVLCQVSDVNFLADPVTDEVYAKFCLVPIRCPSDVGYYPSPSPHPISYVKENGVVAVNERSYRDVREAGEEITSFSKILTPSDANNGGGFSVPRFCADSIFPPLNYQADPPVQKLTATDVHGVSWDFRHIYRGTPRRHLLTTGWSKFVNNKKLVAGDSVLFMRSVRGDLFIGVRRTVRFSNNSRGGDDVLKWRDHAAGASGDAGAVSGDRLRSGTGRVSTESSVMQAVERASMGLPFEALYYPKVGWYSDFVVRAEEVEAAMHVLWRPGMRVKMSMETEDSSRTTWFQGTIISATFPIDNPLRCSPWRMIQIRWDEPDVLQNSKRVSPWQVEYVTPSSSLDTFLPQPKKFKFLENSTLLSEGERKSFLPMSGSSESAVCSSLLSYSTFPAGIQGTRQDIFSTFGVSSFVGTHPSTINSPSGENTLLKMKSISTNLNIGNTLMGNLSPDCQSTGHYFGTDLVENQEFNQGPDCISSFQLFGKVIHLNTHAGRTRSFENVMFSQEDSRELSNEKEGINNPTDISSSSYSELHTELGIQAGAETWTG